ncbi:hypothetical protein ASG60_17690 [Methylobacterium sp. Leaf469]|nr:hypothetical protein ASG60_17690 [Methylobacterium sp. Leaf469]
MEDAVLGGDGDGEDDEVEAGGAGIGDEVVDGAELGVPRHDGVGAPVAAVVEHADDADAGLGLGVEGADQVFGHGPATHDGRAPVEPATPRLGTDDPGQGEAAEQEQAEARDEDGAQPDARVMVGDLGKHHHGRHDEENERPGGHEAQGRLQEAAQGPDAVEPHDLEEDHRDRGDAEDRRGVTRTERNDARELEPLRGQTRDTDEGELRDPHTARQHDGREGRCRPSRGLGRGDRARAARQRSFLFGSGKRSGRGFQKVADVEGTHRQGFRTSVNVASPRR